MNAAAYKAADEMGQQVTAFFAACAGKVADKLEEMAVLLDWNFAIEAAQQAALDARDWASVDEFDNMMDECNMWLDHCKAAA